MSAAHHTRSSGHHNYEHRTSFRIVEFDEGRGKKKTVELIPSDWLSEDEGKLLCRWPDQTTGLASLTRLVKYKNSDSTDIQWKLYPARLIGAEIDNYDNGLDLVDKAQRTSNLDTSEPDQIAETTQNRTRNLSPEFHLGLVTHKQITLDPEPSSDEESNDEQQVFVPPQDLVNIYDKADLNEVLQIQNQFVPPQTVDTPRQTGSSVASPVSSVQPVDQNLTLNKLYTEFRKYQEVSVSLLKTIVQEVREIRGHQLSELQTKDSGHASLHFCSLPLMSEEELASFESSLESEQNKHQLVNHLSTVGGKDIGSLVRRMLVRLFWNPLQSETNFTGRGKKYSFKSLTVYGAFILVELPICMHPICQ